MLGLLSILFLCIIELAAASIALKGKDEAFSLEDFHRFYRD